MCENCGPRNPWAKPDHISEDFWDSVDEAYEAQRDRERGLQ